MLNKSSLARPSFKTGFIVLAALAGLGCSESEPAKVVTDVECFPDMPIAHMLRIYPSSHPPAPTHPDGIAASGNRAVSRIPLGHTVIVITFDKPPYNIRVTNQPDAQWPIHKWYMHDATTLFLEVTPLKTDGLVHVSVDWHSGGRILKWVSHKF